MHTLLVIDDDLRWVETIRDKLHRRGFRIEHTTRAEEGFERARVLRPDIIILDLLFQTQPIQGEDVLAALKGDSRTRDIPVIVYSIKHNDYATRVLVTQYSINPIVPRERFSNGQVLRGRKWEMLELLQLIFGILDNPEHPRIIWVGRDQLELGDGYRHVWVNGKPRRLTPRDADLLEILDKHRGEFLTNQRIGDLVHDKMANDEYAIRQAIHTLRRQLEPDSRHPRFILNESGFGYMLTKGDPPPALEDGPTPKSVA